MPRPRQSRSPATQPPGGGRRGPRGGAGALAGALLVGLVGNALLGLRWLDPVVAPLIAAVAVQEGREAWRGEGCCVEPLPAAERADDPGMQGCGSRSG